MSTITVVIPADVAQRVQGLDAYKKEMMERALVAVAHRSLMRADVLGIQAEVEARRVLDHHQAAFLRIRSKARPGSRRWRVAGEFTGRDLRVLRRQIDIIVEDELNKD